MDYTGLRKRLSLPEGVDAPRRLVHGDVVATALNRGDLADDTRGINESLELITRTRGGRWPTGPVTEDYNFVDAVWHECEFRDGSSFTYVLRDASGRYLGCCYLYPMGTRTPLDPDTVGYDVDASWWVTPSAYAEGYYVAVYEALRHWLSTAFPFWRPYFSNREIP